MFAKKEITRLTGFIILTSISLTGCQKVFDYVQKPGKGDTEFRQYAIKKVSALFNPSPGTDTVHYIYNYNKEGNPISVTNDKIGTGNPNILFTYDKKGRLSQMIRPYGGENQNYETWNKYGYNSANQIVRDTQYTFGSYINNIPYPDSHSGDMWCRTYEYDSQNRIVRENDSIYYYGVLKNISQENFIYDDNGNLQSYGISHDNKINIRRTNKIWMFITRDYSINNSFVASEYNLFGLPFDFPNAYQALGILAPVSGNGSIEYERN
jgi:hypothetical protein